MVLVGEIVTVATGSITLFKGLRTLYRVGRKMMSNKWKDKLKEYEEYLRGVEKLVKRYKNSKHRKTSITAALTPLEGALKESESITAKWLNKFSLYKRVMSDNFMKKLESSQNRIARNVQLLEAADRKRSREEEGNLALPQTRTKAEFKNGAHTKKGTSGEKEKQEVKKGTSGEKGNLALPKTPTKAGKQIINLKSKKVKNHTQVKKGASGEKGRQ